MCGIAGFAGQGEYAHLVAMTRALAHRGPDDEQFFIDQELRVFLGFRRLAVIDLLGGAQPMWNGDRSIGVIFNGEIYNQRELRSTLEGKGYRFHTDHSDTEVLVHGYAEWGQELPVRLNGMFAFAILDRVRQWLFLSRDRFGEKPLYYSASSGSFVFASELTALIHHPKVDRTLDPRTLQKFFAYGYVPAPGALYRGTKKLPGGCNLTVDLRSGQTKVARYWRFAIEAEETAPPDRITPLADELRHLLDIAVARRLVSDVPLGVFLSGGLDSSAVLALASRHRPAGSLNTFTIGFKEPSFDESMYARGVAERIGTRHHERILSIDTARDAAPALLDRLGEPLGDASILPTWLLSAFARGSVKVALSGDGGDELFAGYDPFAALKPSQWYRRLVPHPVHLLLRRLVNGLPRSTANMSLDFRLRRAITGLSYPPNCWNPVWMAPLEPAILRAAFEEPLVVEDLYSEAIEAWDRSTARNFVDRTLEFFTNLYLQDNILTKTDRASMMVSLEARAVFLDNDVVEFCRHLPHGYKFRDGRRKFLLKKAMSGLVPESVLRRPKKGFGIPLATWLHQIPSDPPLRPVEGVRMPWVSTCWRDFRVGRSDERLFLWSWLSLQSTLNSAATIWGSSSR